MNVLNLHITSKANLSTFYLSHYVEYRIEDNQIMFYNTLFNNVLFLSMNNKADAEMFISEFANGVENIDSHIAKYFTADNREIYKLLVQKKIIE